MGHHYLHQFLSPRSIAVVGASDRETSVGTRVLENILSAGFKGPVYPVNPKYQELQSLTCYPALSALPEPAELVVITTPAATVIGIVNECGELGCRHVIVMSGGFGDAGASGRQLEQRLQQAVHRHGIHLLGPDCMGVMRPRAGLNATFSRNQSRDGGLALISQSGAICTSILDWAETRKLGFSSVVTLGDAADVDFGDVLDSLALDRHTKSILLYVEGIRNARSFMSGLRSASRMKPVIVLKAGRHAEGARAASTHTGAIVGSFDAFDAALQRAGVVRVDSITQLFTAAEILSSGIHVRQNRLLIITNAGGPGVMATDRAVELGLSLSPLGAEVQRALGQVLPFAWSHGNPVDILGDATPERYEQVLDICLREDNMDAVLVMLTPQAMTDPTGVAETLVGVRQRIKKPILACWMGGTQVAPAREILSAAGIPCFSAPEQAVEAFSYLACFHSNQKLLMQVPPVRDEAEPEPDIRGARLIIESVLGEGRRTLSTIESRAILAAFGIPSTPAILVRSPTEALVAAESLGYPVVMKISSPDVVHKSDVNGVRMNINSANTVRSVYQELVDRVGQALPGARIEGVTVESMDRGTHVRELMIGVVRDPVFGPVISFGAGGTAVEIMRDHAVVLPPLNEYMIRKTIDRTRIADMLKAFRQMPEADGRALEQVMQRVSVLVCELPEVVEMDINPLLADDKGVRAVDARFVVGYADREIRPYGHMAIHPYPSDLVRRHQLVDGTDIVIRPLRPEDAAMEQQFVRNLSGESRYMRFMQSLRELTPDMLVRLTQIDYDREMAFIALVRHGDPAGGDLEIGVSRIATLPDGQGCEFALVVGDAWRNRGLGGLLMQVIIDLARSKGLHYITGDVLAENSPMINLMRRLGFEVEHSRLEPGVVVVTRHLVST
ncbi:MAG TPA: bifunctional acetate--CoA ligase family protein/GNAT family N-acetyltransferase [Thiolinea sp.]|nr:bifunctional acetate--CoA ligase family protein/GNAT family N-acetyltransferase [Thiolinea sp.]